MACVLVVMLVIVVGCSRSDRDQDSAASRQERVAAAVDRQLNGDSAFDDVRAIVVQADGDTVLERYRDSAPADSYAVQSVTKSIVSTLIGIAIGENRLSLDARLSELLPTYAARMRPKVADVTLEQLLTHTAGFVPEEAENGLSFVDAADPIAHILASGSGEGAFSYSSAGAQLMSAVLVEATGVSVLEYARTKLFDPLGIDTRPAAEPLLRTWNIDRYQAAGFAWPVDLAGLHQAWSFLKLRIDDLVKIGQLYLDHGRWKGEQVVPAEWATAAITRHVDAHDGPMAGYGFQWWVEEVNGTPAYMAWGFGGQMLQVVPAHRLIIAVATELRFGDPNSRGVDAGPLTHLVKSAVINAFTDNTPN